MTNQGSTAATLQTKTFGPWRAPGRVLAVAGFAGIGLAIMADNIAWGFYCACAVLLGEAWERGKYPSIVLTPGHLILRLLPGLHRKWAWDDLGPFVLRRVDRYGISRFFLLAFSDQAHDIYAAKGHPREPDWLNAYVRIELQLIIGPFRRAAKGCRDDINAWREVYGQPEIDVANLAAAEAKWAAQQRQQEGYVIAGAVGLAILVPVGIFLAMWLSS